MKFYQTGPYSPVAWIANIIVLLALTASYDLHVHQMDVKTAFLYGEFEKKNIWSNRMVLLSQ